MAESSAEFPTTIGADAVFKGQLQFEKGVRLLGKFEGEITSDGEMVIAEGAAQQLMTDRDLMLNHGLELPAL